MGTTYRVTYVATREVTPPSRNAVEELLREINESVSNYMETSLISRVNASRDASASYAVDRHFAAIFLRSKEIHKETGGAFNPALGPLIDAWGFGSSRRDILPDDATVRKLLAVTSFDAFQFDPGQSRLQKRIAEAQLDFGGIAKGYAVDAIARLLDDRGIQNYLVEIAGEMRARGKRPERNGWHVGIERPAANALADRTIQAVVALEDRAISTSGNYRNFQESEGRRVGHILNSRTGYPSKSPLLSATVIANDAMTADGYATALMAMGLDEGVQFVEGHKDLAAYFLVMDSDGQVIETRSSRFPETLAR